MARRYKDDDVDEVYEVAPGVDIGPWDSESAPELGEPESRHGLSDSTRRHVFESMSLVLPGPRSAIDVERHNDGTPCVLHIYLNPTRTTGVSVFVMAAPHSSVPLWQAEQGDESMWAQIRADITERESAHGATVVAETGVFGTYLLIDSPTARSVVYGVDGVRWTVQVTAWTTEGADVPDAYAQELLASIVVTRGAEPIPPGSPLPLSIVR